MVNCNNLALNLIPFKPDDKFSATFIHSLRGQYIDGKVDIQHLFSWQGVFNVMISLYFLLLSIYFEAVILSASKNTYAQEKD